MPRLVCAAVLLAMVAGTGSSALAQDGQALASAHNLFEAGYAALTAGNPRQALELFQLAVTESPSWSLAFLGLGMAAQTLDPKSDQALNSLQRAVELAPQNPRAQFQLGLLFEQRGEFASGVEHFRTALALRPSYDEVHFHLAAALAGAKDLAGAVKEFGAVLALQPDHPGALVGLAEAAEQLGDLAAAEKARLTLIASQPSTAYNHYELGRFYERIGEAKKAKKAFAQAQSLDPQPQRHMRQLKP